MQRLVYQNQLEPVAELNADGSLRQLFVYADKGHVPSLIIRRENGSDVAYRVVSDYLGSVRLVIKLSDGQVVQRINYDEYGVVLSDSNPGFQPFGYAGGIDDRDVGSVRFGARDYLPSAARWMTKDPVGFGGGSNLYAYLSGNPVGRIDVMGLQSTPPGISTTESGWEVNIQYLRDKALEALAFPVTAPVAAIVQTKGYYDMRKDNTVGNDKYFHCVANCESGRAAGTMAACVIADAREDFQDMTSWHNEDREADEAANAFGRNGAAGSGSCQQQCSPFIVDGINPRYLPNGS